MSRSLPRTTEQPDAFTFFEETRARSTAIAEPLSAEDMTIQSMEDASPAKWHLAHTSWFFEQFILRDWVADYQPFDPSYPKLFNSYYAQAGARFARPRRGLVTRPGVEETLAYRRHVDAAMRDLLAARGDDETLAGLVTLGCHHEMQHQELMHTDLLHGFSFNPLEPIYRAPSVAPVTQPPAFEWLEHPGGVMEIGHTVEADAHSHGDSFAFDCEGPRHETLLRPFRLANRSVTNREWIAFIEDGGYRREPLWLSDGWAQVQREGWDAPLYWRREGDEWWSFTLRGAQPVNLDAPVTHVSFYEAEAYARWAGARLPGEAEWEVVARDYPIAGNFLEHGALRPLPNGASGGGHQFWGDVWEWTQSPFTPYPGYRAPEGAIGEYNGKFMVNQMVLRGGSCVTPARQMRPTYRNFFYPHQRWQMTGLRLAQDASAAATGAPG